ncbi:MAG: HAMP domain-containing protein, partial [Desulfosarcina sp.]|nr:HAMP domain-containing protein [Desulfobacterales bacterium]
MKSSSMTPRKRFQLKNRMLLANFIANLVGAVGVNSLLAPTRVYTTALAQEYARSIETIFIPTVFGIAMAATLVYQRPIRRYVDRCCQAAVPPAVPPAAPPQAVQRRVLNEPFFGLLLDFTIWILAAVFWAGLFYFMDETPTVIQRAVISNLSIGLITCTVAFFVLEHILQKVMIPFFFPAGQLYGVPRTIRISIRIRLAALLFACNLVPFVTQIFVYVQIRSAGYDPATALERLGTHLMITSPIFIAVGLWLFFLVSSNLARPLWAIIRALQKVRAGNFDAKVQVTSNDEIGYTGDVINQMTEGLKEHESLRLSMLLAREVQQNLLPTRPPRIKGLDLA